jgi:hypothetical protein
MCDKELVVGYLYGELSREDRDALDAHLATCAECRVEVEELRSTRQYLTLWAPPEPDLGFRVIRGGAAPVAALPRRSRFVTAFAYAAAAVVVVAAGAAIASFEVSYGSGGMTIRTGWARTAPREAGVGLRDVSSQVSGPATDPGNASARSNAADFAALDQRLRELESALSAPSSVAVADASGEHRLSDAEMLRRVRQIVSEAESRQQTDIARRLLDVARAFDIQRRADLAQIQQGLGQYQGQTNAEIAQNRELVNQIIRAAARQEK